MTVTSSSVYMLIKMFLFIFLRQKKATNEANWSEVYRNGLHSLESLDLEDSSITVYELQLVWYVCCQEQFITNSYPTSLYLSLSLGDHWGHFLLSQNWLARPFMSWGEFYFESNYWVTSTGCLQGKKEMFFGKSSFYSQAKSSIPPKVT